MPEFADFCGEFLRFQIQVLSPKLLVVMGPDARLAFDAFAKSTGSGRVLFVRHPYADFGLSTEVRVKEIENLARAWVLS